MANQNITISPTRVSPLILPESGSRGATVRYTVDFSDIKIAALAAATDTVTVLLGNTPTRWVGVAAFAVVAVPFAGPGGLSVIVGTTANPACLIPGGNALAAGVIQPVTGVTTVANPGQATGIAAAPLQIVFTSSVSGGPAALTAGVYNLYLTILNPDTLY
jgi:hypothetical protein